GQANEVPLRFTSIPNIRSGCCPPHLPRIRTAPRPCSGGTIVVAWFENKLRRENSRFRLSLSCLHHVLSKFPFFGPWSSSPLGLRRTVFRRDGQWSDTCRSL